MLLVKCDSFIYHYCRWRWWWWHRSPSSPIQPVPTFAGTTFFPFFSQKYVRYMTQTPHAHNIQTAFEFSVSCAKPSAFASRAILKSTDSMGSLHRTPQSTRFPIYFRLIVYSVPLLVSLGAFFSSLQSSRLHVVSVFQFCSVCSWLLLLFFSLDMKMTMLNMCGM